MSRFFLVLMALLATGCLFIPPGPSGPRFDPLITWPGVHISELISAWGKPDQSHLDGELKGGARVVAPEKVGWRIYAWVQSETVSNGYWGFDGNNEYSYIQLSPDEYYSCSTMAYTRPDGIIDRVESSGDCYRFSSYPSRPGSRPQETQP